MRKIKYKDMADGFVKMVAPEKSIHERPSVGMEKFVGEYYLIDVEKLIPYKNQARKIFDEKDLVGLANTIKEHGIRQPLTIVKSKVDDGKFEVVSGERRLRAAKIIGLTKVPCIILDSEKDSDEIALVENIQRSDLHPVELARSIKKIVDSRGWGSQTELTQKIGLSSSQLSELIKITDLSLDVQQRALEKNFRGRENFRKLFSLKSDEDKINFIENDTSTSENSRIIKNISVLRISFSSNEINIQKNALSKLTSDQKKVVRSKLEDILRELS